jgi:hypothetical protein
MRLTTILTIAAIAAGLAACGKTPDTAVNPATRVAETSAEAAAASDPALEEAHERDAKAAVKKN